MPSACLNILIRLGDVMKSGWFKFYRNTFDNPICTKDSEYFFVWCYLLSEAAYEEKRVIFKNEEILLKKGQTITTVTEIANALKISRSKVERILKKLKIEMQIDTKTCSRNTIITVLNWEKYQSSDTQSDTQVIHERYADDTQLIRERYASGEPSYYIKEIKNNKNEKEEKKEKNERKHYYPDDALLEAAFQEYLSMRNKIKKPLCTSMGIHRAMNMLENLSGGNHELAIKILNQSVDHCWQGLFELKDEAENQKNKSLIDEWRDA